MVSAAPSLGVTSVDDGRDAASLPCEPDSPRQALGVLLVMGVLPQCLSTLSPPGEKPRETVPPVQEQTAGQNRGQICQLT